MHLKKFLLSSLFPSEAHLSTIIETATFPDFPYWNPLRISPQKSFSISSTSLPHALTSRIRANLINVRLADGRLRSPTTRKSLIRSPIGRIVATLDPEKNANGKGEEKDD